MVIRLPLMPLEQARVNRRICAAIILGTSAAETLVGNVAKSFTLIVARRGQKFVSSLHLLLVG